MEENNFQPNVENILIDILKDNFLEFCKYNYEDIETNIFNTLITNINMLISKNLVNYILSDQNINILEFLIENGAKFDNIKNEENGFIYSKYDEKKLVSILEKLINGQIDISNIMNNSLEIRKEFEFIYYKQILESIKGK